MFASAAGGSAKCSSVKLDRTTSNDASGNAVGRAAQVDDGELVEVGERLRRLVDIDADQPIDATAEGLQVRHPAAAGVERRDAGRRLARDRALAIRRGCPRPCPRPD